MQILTDKQDEDVHVFSVGEYLREGYISRAITLRYRDDRLKKIYIVSDRYGTVEWMEGTGMMQPHRWESEEQAQGASSLSRHYTIRIIDGIMPESYGTETILSDFENCLSYGLYNHLKFILSMKHWNHAGELVERLRSESA